MATQSLGSLLCFPSMIAKLTGTIERLAATDIIVTTGGVGYLVTVPIDVYEEVDDQKSQTLWISTYVREDRLDLFGFTDNTTRNLFELLCSQSGIGPKTALELCAVPKELLMTAIDQQDPSILTSVKGIGKKTAEKLLVELKSVAEKQPELFQSKGSTKAAPGQYDNDAIEALIALGYDRATTINLLKHVPKDIETTEERVAAALRSL